MLESGSERRQRARMKSWVLCGRESQVMGASFLYTASPEEESSWTGWAVGRIVCLVAASLSSSL